MKNFIVIFIFICIAILGGSGCIGECRNKAGGMEYRELAKLMPSIDPSTHIVAERKFSQYPVDQQITIFLYARNCPDDPRIVPFLIHNGESKIPNIVKRIEKEEMVWDKTELVLARDAYQHKVQMYIR